MAEEWVVVHDRVVIRAEPSKDGKVLGFERKGAKVSGIVEEHAGVPWLKGAGKSAGYAGDAANFFMMIDGSTVGLGVLLEKVAGSVPAAVEGDYWVVQGPLFKKPGSNPETQKIIGLKRPLASVVKTTGKTWKGPSGGEWVELDPKVEKPGWLLVEGPGVGVSGPLLEKAEPGQMPPIAVKLYSMITESDTCEICVHQSQTIGVVKIWVALRDPHGLKAAKVIVSKEMPTEEEAGSFSIANFPREKLLNDGVKLGDTDFKSGDRIPYFYMGEPTDDGRFAKDDKDE